MNKEELKKLILASESKLATLKAIPYDGLQGNTTELESVFNEFKEGGETLLNDNDVLQIGIVGQVKAGKSSFLNSLFFNGENILPKASTPMTAGLTILEYAETNTFEVEYFSEKDWEIFANQDEEYKKREQEVRAHNPGASELVIRKELEGRTTDRIRSAHEMVSACTSKAKAKIGVKNDSKEFTDIADLQNVLEQYVGVSGEFTSVVKSLYIRMNDERLKGLRIVDTPGVNDPVVSRENRTRTFLHSCHGVFLLSASTSFLNSEDVSFLNSRIGGSGIGSVVLLASKFDSILQNYGAGLEMKGKDRSDLADAASLQTRKLKLRLRDLSDTINEKLRGRVKLDTTAGIGYSIAHKPAEKWDDMEKQVVKQMQRYYPDYFSNDDDIKDTFEQLANITDIREKYLDGVFMSNKDSIIAEKIKEFFVAHKQEISTTIDGILKEYKTRRQQLNETTITEIQKQRDMQAKLFDGLKDKFANNINQFGTNLQNNVTHIANSIQQCKICTIPVEDCTVYVEYKGMLWGHNNKDISIKQVNTYDLCEQVRTAFENYAKEWNAKWQERFNNTRSKLSEELCKSISDFEKKIMSSSFDDSYYRRLIDGILGKLTANQELNIRDIISRYQNSGEDIANNQYYPSGTKEYKESALGSYINTQFEEHKKRMLKEFQNLTTALSEDIKNEVNKNFQEATSVVMGMEDSFGKKLKEEGEEYLAKLERDMEEKTEVLKQIERVITCVAELSNLYK